MRRSGQDTADASEKSRLAAGGNSSSSCKKSPLVRKDNAIPLWMRTLVLPVGCSDLPHNYYPVHVRFEVFV